MINGPATYRQVIRDQVRRATTNSSKLAWGGITILLFGLALDNDWAGALVTISLLMLIGSGIISSTAKICCPKCDKSVKNFVMPTALHIPGIGVLERKPVPLNFCPNCGVDLDSESDYGSRHLDFNGDISEASQSKVTLRNRIVGQICSACGFKNETGWRAAFCPQCGVKIDSLGSLS